MYQKIADLIADCGCKSYPYPVLNESIAEAVAKDLNDRLPQYRSVVIPYHKDGFKAAIVVEPKDKPKDKPKAAVLERGRRVLS